MKKLLSILLVLAMIFSMAACGSNDSAGDAEGEAELKPVVLTIGNVAVGEDQPYNHVLQYAQEYLTEAGSTVSLDMQTAGVLGGERELVEQTIAGAIPMCQIADMSLSSFIPQAAFVTFPGLMPDYDAVKELYVNGWVGETLNSLVEEKGLKLLGVSDNGFRWITNSKHEVVEPEDLTDLLVRVPESDIMLDFWAAMGAQTTPIAWGELATALQQGVVDGQEVCPMTFAQYGFQEYNQYGTEINYAYSAVICLMNQAAFDALAPQQQEELVAAFEHGNAKMMEEAIAGNDATMQSLVDGGFVLSEPSQAMMDKIAQVGYDLAHSDKWMEILGADLVATMYGE